MVTRPPSVPSLLMCRPRGDCAAYRSHCPPPRASEGRGEYRGGTSRAGTAGAECDNQEPFRGRFCHRRRLRLSHVGGTPAIPEKSCPLRPGVAWLYHFPPTVCVSSFFSERQVVRRPRAEARSRPSSPRVRFPSLRDARSLRSSCKRRAGLPRPPTPAVPAL